MRLASTVNTTEYLGAVPVPATAKRVVRPGRPAGALDVIDELLRSPRDRVSGEESDLLLDLRWQLRQRAEAEATLRLFCDLRVRMENRHYLAFFRLRRWLERDLVATVRMCPAAEERTLPVKLDHYCVEAIRRVCLCASLGYGSILLAPKLRFGFRTTAVSA